MRFRGERWERQQAEYAGLPEMPPGERRMHHARLHGRAKGMAGLPLYAVGKPGDLIKGNGVPLAVGIDGPWHRITLSEDEHRAAVEAYHAERRR